MRLCLRRGRDRIHRRFCSPIALFFRTEDPAAIVLGLDDEDAVTGNDDVIDLGSAFAIRPGQIEAVEVAVS